MLACHSEGATRSKSKSKKIKVKGDVTKVKATEESPVQTGWKNQFDLTQQKNRTCLWKRKILRRPMECESFAFATDAKAELLHSLWQFDVGLLRMTNL
jgi:hypothetical protein